MRDNFKYVGLLAAAGLLGACASQQRLKVGEAPGGEVIEATGEAMIVDGDPVGTRTRSLTDAQKKAIEMVVGVHLTSKTMVEKAMIIQDNILAKTEGYIQKYDVEKEWTEAPLYKTKIRAMVKYQQLTDDLNALGLLKKPEVGMPRVAVLLTEKVDGVGPGYQPTSAGQAMTQALLDKGYRVVDRADLMAAKAEEVAQAVDKGDASQVPNLGKKLDAEVLIFGNAQGTRLQASELGGLFSYRVSINAQAYKSQTNEVLMTDGEVASGLDASQQAAADKALASAGKMAGQKLADSLASQMAKKASVSVTVENVKDMNALHDFQTALSALPGVGDWYLRNYEGGTALLDVDVKDIGSQDIANGLSGNDKLKAKVASVTHDTLEVQLQP